MFLNYLSDNFADFLAAEKSWRNTRKLKNIMCEFEQNPALVPEDFIKMESVSANYGYIFIFYFIINHLEFFFFLMFYYCLIFLLNSKCVTCRCKHYKRRCKIRAPCCNETFDCRHCHNEAKVCVFFLKKYYVNVSWFCLKIIIIV